MTYHEIETEREEMLAKIIQLVLEQDTLIRKLNTKLAEVEKQLNVTVKIDDPTQAKPKKKPGPKPGKKREAKPKTTKQETAKQETVPVYPPDYEPESEDRQLTIDDIKLINSRRYDRFMGTNLGALVNQEPTSRSSTGVKGVYRMPGGVFEARVTVEHKERILYRGADFALACRAREMGVEEYYRPIIEKAKEIGKLKKEDA